MSAEKMREKYIEKRNNLWPSLEKGSSESTRILWERKRKTGFVNIPRSMPIILNIMDYLSNKAGHKTVRDTYLALWCRDFGTALVEIKDSEILALEAGFTGGRATNTLNSKIKILGNEEADGLGFIRTIKSNNDKYKYILMLNPMLIIHLHYCSGKLPKNKYDELYLRCIDIGDNDLKAMQAIQGEMLESYKKYLEDELK